MLSKIINHKILFIISLLCIIIFSALIFSYFITKSEEPPTYKGTFVLDNRGALYGNLY